eukprot:gnl/TRDRNA2_/TRDRNA2_158641_c0_seq2.p1 gnl/TRDRNA2_/TRDRNA2_158641_c0~~gnl/TRDRNA2_/TRDRNA2_158641_c0_seq2.p1  ORF type:complete len:371 (+),score=65.25 gnl/TRDRNA2_/TRDRNA2_158641_c0_seq2:58-1113(+)
MLAVVDAAEVAQSESAPQMSATDTDARSPEPTRQPMPAEKQKRSPNSPGKPHWKLNIREQRVLKAGILRLHRDLVVKPEAKVWELQRSAAPMLRRSFLQRLLRGDLKMQSCMASDVAAAQHDLKHLSTEQLLSIRVPTLDFLTASASHSAHNNFLESLDKVLFEKLCRQLIRVHGGQWNAKPADFHAVGLKVTRMLGADEALAEDHSQRAANPDLPSISTVWMLELYPIQWGGSRFALFNAEEFSIQVLAGETPDLSAEGLLNVVWDRSVGAGADRQLSWEIAVVDAQVDDVFDEIHKASLGSTSASVRGKVMGNELAAVLAKRDFTHLGVARPKESSEGTGTAEWKKARK